LRERMLPRTRGATEAALRWSGRSSGGYSVGLAATRAAVSFNS
jgi:hypothetical protein